MKANLAELKNFCVQKSDKILNWYPFAIIISFVLFKPAFFTQIPVLDKAYDVFQIAAGLLLVAMYVLELVKRKKANPIILLVALYYLVLCISTLINDGDLKQILIRSANFVVICILIDLLANHDLRRLIVSLTLLFEIYVYINFVIILIFPNGLYTSEYFRQNYFLGYKNQMINIILPAMCLSILNYYQTKPAPDKQWLPWLRTCMLIFISTLSAVLVHSGASTLMTAAMLLFWFLQGFLSAKVFNFRNYLILNILFFFVIVIFRMQDLFAFIIEDVLHKDLTLTGRTVIWDRTYELIAQKPILGYGVQFYEERQALYHIETGWISKVAGMHAHDRFLETVYRGGFILLLDYLAILLATNHYLMKFRNSRAAKALAFTIFIYLMGMITEVYDFSPMFFGLMTLSYHCGKFESLKKSK